MNTSSIIYQSFRGLLILLALALTLAGCGVKGSGKFSAALSVDKSELKPGESTGVYADLENHPDDLNYRWSATGGQCDPQESKSPATQYIAPISLSQDEDLTIQITAEFFQAGKSLGKKGVSITIKKEEIAQQQAESTAQDNGPVTPTAPEGPNRPQPCFPAACKHDFETDFVRWKTGTKADGQGGISVTHSRKEAKSGNYSLMIEVDLNGGDSRRDKCETYVEMPTPQNLEGKTITVWVYVPEGAIGQTDKYNGIQLFVKGKESKGKKWKSLYGSWWNINLGVVNEWQQVKLMPGRSKPKDGFMDDGFDPTQILRVGIKVAIGDGSTATYKGPIYIDAVDWR